MHSQLQTDHVRAVLIVLVAVCVLTSAAVVPGAVVADDSDDDPPAGPASYYGQVTVDGEPAANATVEAYIDGEKRGEIETDETGQYGGPALNDGKLTVDGEAAEDGEAEVTFRVDGQTATSNPDPVIWEEFDVKEVDLEVEDQADFQITDLTTDSSTVTAGETVTAEAAIENQGSDAGVQNVTFAVDGNEEAVDPDVQLGINESTTVSFSYATTDGDVGDLSLSVDTLNDAATTTVTVEDPPEEEPEESFFAVEIDDDSQTDVDVGDPVVVNATVENTGDTDGTTDVELTVNDTVVDNASAGLDAGESETVTLTADTDLDDVGDVDVSVFTEDDSASVGATVSDPGVTASIVTDRTTASVGDIVAFDASDSTGGGELTYEWDFDDGSNADGAVTDHEFDTAGTYDVTLTVTDEFDRTDTETVTIEIGDTEDETPGFGVLSVLVALLSTLGWVRLRHEK